MSFRQVFHQLSLLMLVLSGVLLAVAAWSGVQWFWGDAAERDAVAALLGAAAVGGIAGGFGALATRRATGSIGRREAMLLVSLSWLLGAALSGTPYRIWAARTDPDHRFAQFVNCYFESMSGLTTTGATILSDIESLPRGILLWRALTHWLGGLGIVVLFVAVLPSLGVGGKKLYRVEAPGPSPDGLSPQIRETARALWFIYIGLTALEATALRLTGMDWFDAVCHTFATLATGGFSTRNASVGEFNSVAADIIIIGFMFLAGMNFGLFYHAWKRRFSLIWQDTELRFYTALVGGGSAIVVLALLNWPLMMTTGTPLPASPANAVRQGVFTTVSVQTTTGFCTSDFNQWPDVAKTVLVALMFVGGCAGSTAGGIKVIRLWTALKVIIAELERAFRPRVVRPVKIGLTALEESQRTETLVFVLSLIFIFAAGAATILLLESGHSDCDFTTAATASVATLCTIGPGLGRVGAVENYGWFTSAAKCVMCLLMVIGRLEIYAILVLLTPRFWRGD